MSTFNLYPAVRVSCRLNHIDLYDNILYECGFIISLHSQYLFSRCNIPNKFPLEVQCLYKRVFCALELKLLILASVSQEIYPFFRITNTLSLDAWKGKGLIFFIERKKTEFIFAGENWWEFDVLITIRIFWGFFWEFLSPYDRLERNGTLKVKKIYLNFIAAQGHQLAIEIL